MSKSSNLPALRFDGAICKESDVRRQAMVTAFEQISLQASSSSDAEAVRFLGAFGETVAIGNDAIIYDCPAASAVRLRELFNVWTALTVRVFNGYLPAYMEWHDTYMEQVHSNVYVPFPDRWEWVQPSFFTIDRSNGEVVGNRDSVEGRLPAWLGGLYAFPPRNEFGKKIDDSNRLVLKVKASGTNLFAVTPASYNEVMEGVGRYWSDIYLFEPTIIKLAA